MRVFLFAGQLITAVIRGSLRLLFFGAKSLVSALVRRSVTYGSARWARLYELIFGAFGAVTV
jgi:hypothetical protein